MYGRTQPVEPSLFLREIDKSCLRIIGNAPYGFGSARYGGQAGARGRAAAYGASKASSDGRWRTGDRVFHDDQGYGAIVDIRESEEDGPVVKVRFENGTEVRFLSLHQSSRFTKISADY